MKFLSGGAVQIDERSPKAGGDRKRTKDDERKLLIHITHPSEARKEWDAKKAVFLRDVSPF
jgi:hypothetical protein